VQSLTDLVVGDFRTTLYIVFAAVGLLLLIACGNVANLLLARATTREKEFAVRSALGASRYRLVRQLLVESLILALGGAAMGALLAWAGLKSLVALMPQGIVPAEAQIRLNAPVLLFTLGVSVLTALVFGLLPAMKASRTDLNDPLRDVGKGLSGGFRHAKLRSAVVILEVALSLTLLVAAGLLMRSFVALREVHLGFRSDHVLVARLPLPVERYKSARQISGFYRPLLQRLKTLPGIVDAPKPVRFLLTAASAAISKSPAANRTLTNGNPSFNSAAKATSTCSVSNSSTDVPSARPKSMARANSQ
jgi:putative ABC transport system permease protein